MRSVCCALVFTLVGLVSTLRGADSPSLDAAQGVVVDGVRFFDIKLLGVEGKGWSDTKAFYDRLPAKAEGVVRAPVWGLSHDSAGLYVRFVTDATAIHARWKTLKANLAMPHMPATGVSGLDLYARDEAGKWRWLAGGRPAAQSTTQVLAQGILPGTREYLLYLPLYNGVESVEVGIPVDRAISKAPAWSGDARPIVFYGTSITQGGCASRPGMCYSAILQRRLDRPVINLGFSGNAKMEPEVATLLAELNPSIFMINALPNMQAAEVKERAESFVQILRRSHPDTPIVLCEDRTYTNARFLPSTRARNDSSRVELRAAYERLVAAGVKHLHYVTGEDQLSDDGEDTVDASHPTDLGFVHMADKFEPVLRSLILTPAQ